MLSFRVGKTSIIKVVFEKLHPFDTKYIDSTNEPESYNVHFRGFSNFRIFDFPGLYDADDLKTIEKDIIKDCGAIIYVADYKVLI